MSIDIDHPTEAEDAGKYDPVESTKPQRDLIPEGRLKDLQRLSEITGHNIDALIAGWWLRFGEVQTLQIELDHARSIITMHEKESPDPKTIVQEYKDAALSEIIRKENSPTPQSIEQEAGQPFESFPELAKIIEWFANNVGVPGKEWNELLRQINKAIAGASANSVPESADVVNALRELVYLKSIKGLDGSEQEYEQRKPLAWAAAKKALGDYNSKKVQSEPTDVKVLLEALQEIQIMADVTRQGEIMRVCDKALSSYQSTLKGGGE